jgi:hypothetical protein
MSRPKTYIVKAGGNCQLGLFFFGAGTECQTEIEHSIDVSPIARVVIPDSVFPCSENLFYEIVLCLNVHA